MVFGRNYVMPVVQQYAAQWPGVDIDVSFSDDDCDLVQEGIAVAVCIGGNDNSRLVRKVLALKVREFLNIPEIQWQGESGMGIPPVNQS